MDNLKRVLGITGIAKKAGRIAIGDEQTKLALQSGKAKLVLLAQDGSKNTRMRFQGMSAAVQIQHIILPATKNELGGAIGRQSCAVAAICDAGMAKTIVTLLTGTADE